MYFIFGNLERLFNNDCKKIISLVTWRTFFFSYDIGEIYKTLIDGKQKIIDILILVAISIN
jgi:hypothetical protein